MKRLKLSFVKNAIMAMCVIVSSMVFLYSCDDMNSLHEKYINPDPNGRVDAPINIGSPDSLYAYTGFEKVRLDWKINADPRIHDAAIFWNNREDTVVLLVERTSPGAMWMELEMDLPEGSYVFEVAMRNAAGRNSQTRTASISVLGDFYRNGLQVREMEGVIWNDFGTELLISWREAFPNTVSTVVTYMNVDREEVVLVVPNNETVSPLKGFSPEADIVVQSRYRPENAFEYFYPENALEWSTENIPEYENRLPMQNILGVTWDECACHVQVIWDAARREVFYTLVVYTDEETGTEVEIKVLPTDGVTDLIGLGEGNSFRYHTYYKLEDDDRIFEPPVNEATRTAPSKPDYPHKLLDKSMFIHQILAGDDTRHNTSNRGFWRTWDGIRDGTNAWVAAGTINSAAPNNITYPLYLTVNLNVSAYITRYVLFGRTDGGNNFIFRQDPHRFRIWGSDHLLPDAANNPYYSNHGSGGWKDDWTLLGEYEVTRPSGGPIPKPTAAEAPGALDMQYYLNGYRINIPEGLPKVQFIRLEVLNLCLTTETGVISEIDIFGREGVCP